MNKKMKRFTKKYTPIIQTRRCCSCNGSFRHLITVNGSLMCHSCYHNKYYTASY